MSACPCCGQALPDQPDPVAELAAEIERRVRAEGYMIALDGTVTELVAAAVLGRERSTLRNWRYLDSPLPYRRVGGRVRYAITDLARFVTNSPEGAG